MEARINLSSKEIADMEIYQLINAGVQDVQEGRVFDFDSVFDELEKGFSANG